MRLTVLALTSSAAALMTLTATAAPIYNNLTPNTQIAVASRPAGASVTEIEAADDFVLSSQTTLNSASLIGRFVPGANGLYPVFRR